MHFQHLLKALRDVEENMVECGVGPGLSLFDFSMVSNASGKPRRMTGYDTSEERPEPTPADGPTKSRVSREHLNNPNAPTWQTATTL